MADELSVAKGIKIEHNVSLRVLDASTGRVIQAHTGHNAATYTMVTGIGKFLSGYTTMGQGYTMFEEWVPKYISLGTMGLYSQECDESGWPIGIGDPRIHDIGERYAAYMLQSPGFGSDGYDINLTNDRRVFGLGFPYWHKKHKERDPETGRPYAVNCELVSATFPRAQIRYRDLVPEYEAELPQTVDAVFSAMISNSALHEFRDPGKDYIFITEAGLWADKSITEDEPDDAIGDGLLAGYRIAPPSRENWIMQSGAVTTPEQAAINRDILRRNILRVGKNQVVQVIWKVQIGGMDQLGGIRELYAQESSNKLYWDDWR